MKIVLVTSRGDDREIAELHREFHLAAGVDAVAATRTRDADWVIESEPNEFWWPHARSLREILEKVPERYGVVDAVTRRLVGPDSMHRVLHDPSPVRKCVQRAYGSRRPVRGWYPIEVLALDRTPLDDETLERGLADGSLAADRRLHDALQALSSGGRPSFSCPTVVEEAGLAADVSALGDAEVVAAQRRLDELEDRVAAIESLTPLKLERLLRNAMRRRQ